LHSPRKRSRSLCTLSTSREKLTAPDRRREDVTFMVTSLTRVSSSPFSSSSGQDRVDCDPAQAVLRLGVWGAARHRHNTVGGPLPSRDARAGHSYTDHNHGVDGPDADDHRSSIVSSSPPPVPSSPSSYQQHPLALGPPVRIGLAEIVRRLWCSPRPGEGSPPPTPHSRRPQALPVTEAYIEACAASQPRDPRAGCDVTTPPSPCF
jgi:hypothetical protein